MRFTKDRWLGNRWPCIDIDPVDDRYLLPVLQHLAAAYAAAMPPVIDLITAWVADWELFGSAAMVHLDVWTFSIAFEDEAVRDRVFADLAALPEDYFHPLP